MAPNAVWAAATPGATNPLNTSALWYEKSGHINSLSIGGSLRVAKDPYTRTLANYNDPCNVNLTSTANLGQAMRNPLDTVNLGLPAGSTVLKAFLYWAGDYDPDPAIPLNYNTIPPGADPIWQASTSTAPDYIVTLNGQAITSIKNMEHSFLLSNTFFQGGSHVFNFFGGYANVTTLVAAAGNAPYTFGGLTVNTRGNHCIAKAVLAGWALHVIYKNPAEPFRVIKLYDGFEIYRDWNILITPNGFTTPTIPKGKLVVTTWEGDEFNSGTITFNENLKINVFPSPTPTVPLSGPLNPLIDSATFLPNQFNGTVNTTSPTFPLVIPSSTSSVGAPPAPWGVDVDHYDISAQLTPGQTSLTTEYSSGADLVILSSEMIVVENAPFADLAISKTHVGNFGVGVPNNYTLTASNVGTGTSLLDEPGPITVVDTLPAGLNYVAASGTGWTCSFAGTLSCSHPGPLVKGSSLPPITLTVNAPAIGTVTNTATVSGSLVDNLVLNNTASDVTNIIHLPSLTVLKSAGAATANPGAVINYTVQVNNTGTGAAISVSQDDRLSPYTAFGVDCMPATVAQPTPHTITFTDGVPTSALTIGAPLFSNDGGTTFAYVPPALGGGVCTFDPNITNFRLPLTGTMPASGQYFLTYQAQVK